MENKDRKAAKVRVTGRVQGVAFRYWTQRQARALGLTGWVRNESDGSVTALIAGPEAAVDAMLKRLSEGPSHALVRGVVIEDADAAAVPPEFRITG